MTVAQPPEIQNPLMDEIALQNTKGLLPGLGELRRGVHSDRSSRPFEPANQRTSAVQPACNQQVLIPALRALAEALDAKDHYTRGHSLRVSGYAATVARHIGLSEKEVREIKLAGELHDIGKIGVPEGLLNKSGSLTNQELRKINSHTVIGERILLPLFGCDSVVVKAARSHHERWDGQGGPDRLKGEKIPLAARIIAVADAFDAMTSSRPYRARLPQKDGWGELEANSGSQFDPKCVDALLYTAARKRPAISGLQTAARRLNLA